MKIELCKGTIEVVGDNQLLGPALVYEGGNVRIKTDTGARMMVTAEESALPKLRVGQRVTLFVEAAELAESEGQ